MGTFQDSITDSMVDRLDEKHGPFIIYASGEDFLVANTCHIAIRVLSDVDIRKTQMQSSISGETQLRRRTNAMTSTKVPDINFLMEPLSDLQPVMAVKPRFVRLLQLDHSGWMKQLRCDGFTDADIQSLETFQHESFNQMELAERLAHLLQGVHDVTEGSDVDHVMAQWISHSGWPAVWETVCAKKFPDPIDATAYTGTHLLNIAATTLAFESLQRSPLSQEGIDWSADESEIREGIALAEAGLAEEASEWPPY